jgi:4-amino-4-deoxy-L-arabinose transferase-like glycosyltransferase
MAAPAATRAVFIAAALLIAFLIVIRQVNHDEGQYVAAIALMRHGWPYLDFPYLQTPLQPLLLSPLSVLPAGWLLVGARCANGLFAFATLLLVYSAIRDRVERRSAIIAIAALACTEAFMMASALARNDTLPMMLLAGAIVALFRAIGRTTDVAALAIGGLLLGLATSAKISAALPAAGAALFLLLRFRRFRLRGLAAFGAGAVTGLVPTVILALAAPEQFWFDVLTYSLEAPRQWWTATGWAISFLPLLRIGMLFALSCQGAIPPALAAAALDRRGGDNRLLLDLMIAGGVVAAALPQPPFVQYLVPLLAPLFARVALAIEGPRRAWHRPILIFAVLTSIGALSYPVIHSVRAFKRGVDLAHAVQQGREVARLAGDGTIVTLSPESVAGADTNLDRSFTTGPFLYRTFGTLGAQALRYGYSPNWQSVERYLDSRPPSLIFLGRESRQNAPSILLKGRRQAPDPPIIPKSLEDPLIHWAEAHGYARVPLPGKSSAFVRPAGR